MPKTKRVIVAPSEAGRIPLDKLEIVVKSMHILPDKRGGGLYGETEAIGRELIFAPSEKLSSMPGGLVWNGTRK